MLARIDIFYLLILLCLALAHNNLYAQGNGERAAAPEMDTAYARSIDSLRSRFLQSGTGPKFTAPVVDAAMARRAEWYCDTVCNGTRDTLVRYIVSYVTTKKDVATMNRGNQHYTGKWSLVRSEYYLLRNNELVYFSVDETRYGAYAIGVKMEPALMGFLSYYYRDGEVIFKSCGSITKQTSSGLKLSGKAAKVLSEKRMAGLGNYTKKHRR